MGRRLKLHEILCKTVDSNTKVYFQPPENLKLSYPCFIYRRRAGLTKFADDNPYNYVQGYEGTLITYDPDSDDILKLASLPMCTHDRHYVSDNLNHDSFVLYY